MLRYDPRALERLRLERQWTFEQLSKKSGVRRTTIFQIAKKKVRPRVDTLAALARGFGIPITAFFTGDGEEKEATP